MKWHALIYIYVHIQMLTMSMLFPNRYRWQCLILVVYPSFHRQWSRRWRRERRELRVVSWFLISVNKKRKKNDVSLHEMTNETKNSAIWATELLCLMNTKQYSSANSIVANSSIYGIHIMLNVLQRTHVALNVLKKCSAMNSSFASNEAQRRTIDSEFRMNCIERMEDNVTGMVTAIELI